MTSSPTELTLVPPNPVSSSSSLQGPPDAQTPASQSIGTAFRALSPQARIGVIVAASFGGTGLLASAVLVGMCLQRRAYRAYKLPPETFKDRTNDLSGDPSTSGWVAGTWPKPKQPMRHSLMALQALKRGTRVKRRRSQMSGSETNTHTSTSRPSIDYSEPTSPGLDRSIRRSLIDSGAVSLLGSTNLVGGYTPAILLSPASLSSLRRDRPSGSTNGPGPQEAGSSTGGYLFPSSSLPQSPRSLASSSSQATDTSVTYIPRSIVSDAPPRLELNLPSQRNRSASADAATVRFTPNRRPELLRSGNTLQGIPVRVPRPSGFNIRRKPVTIAYEGNDGGSPTYESR